MRTFLCVCCTRQNGTSLDPLQASQQSTMRLTLPSTKANRHAAIVPSHTCSHMTVPKLGRCIWLGIFFVSEHAGSAQIHTHTYTSPHTCSEADACSSLVHEASELDLPGVLICAASLALSVVALQAQQLRADVRMLHHHVSSLRLEKNFPVAASCGGCSATHTGVSAPVSAVPGPLCELMSVLHQPGHTALTNMPCKAPAIKSTAAAKAGHTPRQSRKPHSRTFGFSSRANHIV